ncbi:MAG: ABC transporter permease [Acidobacteriota bacterium]
MSALRNLLRPLRSSPGFSAVTVVTLALGIAAAVSVFSLIDGVLLEQLPYPESGRLVELDHASPGLGLEHMGMSEALFHYYVERSESLQDLALYSALAVTLTQDDGASRLPAARVTPSLFATLATPPARGRTFTDEEARREEAGVVVLAHSLWQDRFGGDENILGRTLRLDGARHEVIGVMPEGFTFPTDDTALWLVRELDPVTASFGEFSGGSLARLAPDTSLERARAEAATMVVALPEGFPEEGTVGVLLENGFVLNITPRLETLVGGVRDVLWVLLAAVGLILAIACANVANLFLARVEERGTELAVRRALGGGQGRLVRGLLTECLSLACLAGLLGVGLAALVVRLVTHLGPSSIPRIEQVGIDGDVLAFAAGITLIAGVLFGLLPALRASRAALVPALKEGRATSAGRSKQGLRGGLVVAQIALGLVLVMVCGLVVRSTMALYEVEPGFQPEGAATFRLALPGPDYPEPEARVRFVEQTLESLAALPGVSQVGAASDLPLGGRAGGSGYSIEGSDRDENAAPPIFMETFVSPGYFEAAGIPLIEGRLLTADDDRQRSGNLLVSQSVAQQQWPGESAIGKRIRPGTSADDQWSTVVGVVGDVHLYRLEDPATAMVYLPFLGLEGTGKDLGSAVSFVLRGETSAATLAPAVRDTVARVDRFLPLTPVEPWSASVASARARADFTVTVLLMAAAMALLIAAIGLYGMISYLVSCRQRELGIRMALGAAQSQIRDLVLRQGMRAALYGVAAGLVLAFGVTRFLHSLLFAVDAQDPATFAIVPVVLLSVAAVASLIPAWRATRIEPVQALRQE